MKRILVVLALVLAACAPTSTSDAEPRTLAEPAPTVTPSPVITPASKVLVIVEENHSFAQMKAQMPYLWSLSQQYGFATNSHGNYHPSQPNYHVILSGSNRGVTSNSAKYVTGSTVLDLTRKTGRTAKTTADGMGKTSRCLTKNNGKYVARHNVEVFYKDQRKGCTISNYDYAYFAGDAKAGKLGNIHLLIPSNAHNGHDASLKTADDWLKRALAPVFAGPDWTSGKLAIVITADEDEGKSAQRILTTVIHPSQSHNVVTTYLDHVSLHKTLARFGHVAPLGTKAAAATDLATAFNLPVE